MSTGGTVDTVESLREQLKFLSEQIERREHNQYERANRHSKIDMVDKYVLALLPALVEKYTNHYALAQDVFDIAEILANHRDEYMEGD
jgi:isoleucyl-tRNA synthetase